MGKPMKNVTHKYTNEDLKQALAEVHAGKSLGFISRQYGIPKTTLFQKKCGHSKPEIGRKGPDSILGDVEEAKLVEWIIDATNSGFSVSKTQLQDSVQMILKSMRKKTVFKNNRPGRHWYDAFKNRHPELCDTLSQKKTSSGKEKVTGRKITQWFEKTKNYLGSKNLLGVDPSRVFTCDEYGFRLLPQGSSILARRADRVGYNFVNGDEKECVGALICGNVAGQVSDPMVVFNYARVPASIGCLMPRGWAIGRSDTGWMTGTSFYDWVTAIFHPWLLRNQIKFPIALFLNRSALYLTLELTNFCREKGIELIALYHHCAHIMQPMDVAVFSALKSTWKAVVLQWRVENNGERLRREQFGEVLRTALNSLNWNSILSEGFRSTGLYPLSPDASNYQENFRKSFEEEMSDDTIRCPLPSEFLEYVESYIDKEVLRGFRFVNAGNKWMGEERHQSLFYFWRRIKEAATTNMQQMPKLEISDNESIGASDTNGEY